MKISRGITNSLKSITERERPDEDNFKSFPSGHVSDATIAATLAARNIDYFRISKPVKVAWQVSSYTVAGLTGIWRSVPLALWKHSVGETEYLFDQPGLEPIVLGVEGPSLGGYATIATVITLDMSRIGQMKAGDLVRFQAVTVDEAADILRKTEEILGEHSIIKRTETK